MFYQLLYTAFMIALKRPKTELFMVRKVDLHFDRTCCHMIQTHLRTGLYESEARMAQQLLIRQYGGYVRSLVGPSRRVRKQNQELFHEGLTGFCIAMGRYDINKKARLTTFARMYIVDSVNQARTRLRPGWIWTHGHAMAYHRIRVAMFRFRQETGRQPTWDELATRLPYSAKRIERILQTMSVQGSWAIYDPELEVE